MIEIIVFDVETTGLLRAAGSPLENQPYIIEFAAVKVNESLEEISRLEFLCKPPMPLPAIITKITGLTDADLADKEPFSNYSNELVEFFTGAKHTVAHNIKFDKGMVDNELRRCDIKLPWKSQICTVESTFHIRNKRLKLADAYKHFTGEEPKVAHRAIDDVLTTLEVLRHLVKQGVVCL